MVLAFGASLLGILSIVFNKVLNGKTVVPSSVHSMLGSVVLVGVLLQVASGLHKYSRLSDGAQPVHAWHGNTGEPLPNRHWDRGWCVSLWPLHALASGKPNSEW